MALALAFGLMLLAALGSVLGLAFYAGTANTRQLLADRTNLLLDTLEERVESFLTPVADAARGHRGRDRPTTTRPDPPARPQVALCTASSRATPQVVGVLFVTPDLKAYRYLRDDGRAAGRRTGRAMTSMRSAVGRGAGRPRRRLGPAGLERRAAARR